MHSACGAYSAHAAHSDGDEILNALDDGNADLPRVKAMLKDIPKAEQLTGAAWGKACLKVTCMHGCE